MTDKTILEEVLKDMDKKIEGGYFPSLEETIKLAIQKTRKEVAKEIFDELEKIIYHKNESFDEVRIHFHGLEELKQKFVVK